MCGIVGFVGMRCEACDVLVDGLRRLEYRGYDSAGVAVQTDGGVQTVKAVGKVRELQKAMAQTSLAGTLGIAHTRWATHGKPSVVNAHPHTAGAITLVHNGIIENYQELKARLQKDGVVFQSETDSEVVAHVIARAVDACGDFEGGVRTAVRQLRGAYALVILSADAPDTLIAVKNAPPLVMGVADDALIFASDASAIVAHTKRVIYVEDGEMVVARKDVDRVSYAMSTIDGAERVPTVEVLDWDSAQAQKDGYAHFMLKEILAQPQAIADAMRGRIDDDGATARLGGLAPVEARLREIGRVVIISCGTSYHAGLVGAYWLEEYAGIPTTVMHASEFRYRESCVDRTTAVIAISQSGETADTLAAVMEAKRKGALTLGIVNVVGSSIARAVDAGVYNHAGPEISVASTKAFTSQLTILLLITLYLGRMRTMSSVRGTEIIAALRALPQQVEEICAQHEVIAQVAQRYAHYENMFYIGRKYSFPIALEGALKIKEIAYVHAEGYPTGEMKHGPIALIDKDFLTVAIVPRDSMYEKSLAGIEEIRARGGHVLAIATDGDGAVAQHADDVIAVPSAPEMVLPLLTVVPLQIFAYAVAVARGCDVDTPRNLAKSVTVE